MRATTLTTTLGALALVLTVPSAAAAPVDEVVATADETAPPKDKGKKSEVTIYTLDAKGKG